MRFTKIKCNEEGVELAWTISDANGAVTSSTYANAAKAAPELPAALEAFKDYVIDLVGLPPDWRDKIVVTTLSLTDIKEGNRRGLQVSVKKSVERAEFDDVDFPVVMAKPALMNAAGEAMAKKLFDEVGVAVDSRHSGRRSGDPVLIGRIRNPSGPDVSFYLGWYFDPTAL